MNLICSSSLGVLLSKLNTWCDCTPCHRILKRMLCLIERHSIDVGDNCLYTVFPYCKHNTTFWMGVKYCFIYTVLYQCTVRNNVYLINLCCLSMQMNSPIGPRKYDRGLEQWLIIKYSQGSCVLGVSKQFKKLCYDKVCHNRFVLQSYVLYQIPLTRFL